MTATTPHTETAPRPNIAQAVRAQVSQNNNQKSTGLPLAFVIIEAIMKGNSGTKPHTKNEPNVTRPRKMSIGWVIHKPCLAGDASRSGGNRPSSTGLVATSGEESTFNHHIVNEVIFVS